MKIVVLDGYATNPGDLSWDCLKEFGELTVYDRTSLTDDAEILERIGDAEVVITNKTPIRAGVVEKAPNMKYISIIATGYNTVDMAACDAAGIPVTNVPGYSTQTVAQYTMALLLEAASHVGHHSAEVYKGRWSNSPDFSFWDYPLMELAGKNFGIIGFGSIGQAAGRMAAALGMNVLAYARHPKPDGDYYRYVSLEELYRESDVISLHCPLTAENREMINKASIAQMKDGVILINTARGPLICEADLRDALNAGKVGYACLDVVSSEPMKEDNPLFDAKNCIITPHLGWAAREARQRLLDIMVDNLRSFLNGESLNVVNHPKN